MNFILSLINTSLEAPEILARVASVGLVIRPITGLNVINYLRNNTIPANKYVSSLNMDILPTLYRIPLSLTKQLRNFAYLVEVTGQSILSGEDTTRYITVSSNSLLTKSQALDIATSMASGENQSGGLNGAIGNVTGIQQNNAGLELP